MTRSCFVLSLVLLLPWVHGCSDSDDQQAPDTGPPQPRRFDVDPAGFDAALAVARDGDVLRLAPGEYLAFETSKAVRMLGGDGVVILAPDPAVPVRVRDIAAGQVFALVDVEIRGPSGDPSTADVVVEDCVGAVVFEDVTAGAFRPSGCGQIVISGSRGRLNAEATVEILVARSALEGLQTANGTEFAIRAADTDVAVVDGSIRGAAGSEAVVLVGASRLRLAAIDALEVRSGDGPNRAPPIGLGVDLVRADPMVTFDPPQTVAREPLTAARIGAARPGAGLVIQFGSPPQTTTSWLIGPLAPASEQPTIDGRVWLFPQVADTIAFTQGGSTQLTTQVPAGEDLRGAVLVVQGIVTTEPIRASIPGVTVIR